MSDRRIFINQHVHTDQIREAGSDLAYQDVRVIDSLSERAVTVNPTVHPLRSQTLVSLALGMHNIPEDVKKSWKEAEKWVTWLMAQAHYSHYPEKFDRKLTEFLEPVDPLQKPIDAIGFLNLSRARLRCLIETGNPPRTDVWITLVRAENLVIKRVAKDGVFMTRPTEPTVN